MNPKIQEVAQLDRVIHEPARLMIMMVLQGAGEADFLYLQREAELTQGNLSRHLTKLEEAGYVQIEKTYRGKVPLTLVRPTKTGRDAFRAYRKGVQRVLRIR